MKLKDRFIRLAAALAIAGFVATLVPMRATTAQAAQPEPDYPDEGGGLFSLQGGGGLILGGVLVAAAWGALTEKGAGGNAGPIIAATNGGANDPIYDVTDRHPQEFSGIAKIIRNAGEVDSYRQQGPWTVFWPTPEALATLPPDTLNGLQSSGASKEKAKQFLAGLTIQGSYNIARLKDAARQKKTLYTITGEPVVITWDETNNILKANDIEIVQTEFPAGNGFVLQTKGLINRGDQEEQTN